MEWQKIDRETAADSYETAVKIFNDDGSVPEKGLRLVIEEARKTTKVTRDVEPSAVADLSILRQAQREFGISKSVGDR